MRHFTQLSSGILLFGLLIFAVACSGASAGPSNGTAANAANAAASNSTSTGATISIDPQGPADTVRTFYAKLRERKFREAIFLTNLRPAIESLTDAELADFSVDLAAIAGDIPADIKINGEIITGDSAAVTVDLPSDDSGKLETQQIKLRRQNGAWIILTVDDATEERIKKDGKDYFYNLRIETHEDEARKMLERIAKAQVAYSLQNGGLCAELKTLIDGGLLPSDVLTSDSTGYNYSVKLSDDKRRYYATATPAEYGKSGRASFLLDIDNKGLPHVSGKDNGGKPLKD
ncbi:MAG: hypothetical protein HS105_02045 [Chloracidobacterium sp.]|nr:hypothetical protein [Chloracidobacterium sp.]MCO5334486.1 type IV pilin-like G/H family protein [Pyrinomonadaceae bacterium]